MPSLNIDMKKMAGENQREMTIDNLLNDLGDMFSCFEDESKKSKKKLKTVWEEDPVDIETFVKGESYLNLGESIRKVVMEDLKEIFGRGDHRKIIRYYNEVIFDEAIGTGKCIERNTIINLANGDHVTIEDLYKSGNKRFEVNTLNTNTLKMETQITSDVIYSGKKRIYKMILRSGKEIKTTNNHPFFTKTGWRQLKQLKAGELVATPRNIEVNGKDVLTEEQIKVLGYMIGDGCCLYNGLGFANINPELRNDFKEAFESFEKVLSVKDYYRTDTNDKNKKRCYGLVIQGPSKETSKFVSLLSKTGLLDKKSATKFIPWQVKSAPLEKLKIFLTRLYATDGGVGKGVVGYGTISRKLADDLVTCLLRFGIHASINIKKRKIKGEDYISYEVCTTAEDSLLFFNKIGYIYGKEDKCKESHEYLLSIKRNTNTDVVPFGHKDMQQYSREAKVPGLYTKYKTPQTYFSRSKLQNFVDDSGVEELRNLAESDIYWDRIESIEYFGEDDVYDLTVPGNHNFVANNIIVHNSFKLSIIIVYLLYLLLCMKDPCVTFGLAKQSKIAIMNMSVSGDQARRVVFGEIKNKIDNSEWFQKKYPTNPRVKSELQFDVPPDNPKKAIPGKVYKNIYIIPGSSSGMAPLGYNLFCAVIDEATLWRDTTNKDYVEDVYNIISRRVTSRFVDPETGCNMGMIVLAGSPMYPDDFLERKIKEAAKDEEQIKDKKQHSFIARRSQWQSKMPDWKGPVFWFHVADSRVFDTRERMNKYKKKIVSKAARKGETNVEAVERHFDNNIIEIPIPYYDDFKKNPEGSKRDLAGLPSETIQPFFENPDIIEERCNFSRSVPYDDITGEFKEWFGPISNSWHAVHIDLGINGDACGIALGHNEGVNETGNIDHFVDCIVRLQGTKENPIQIESVRELIYTWTKMGFMIGLITLDGFQSVDTMQLLAKKGYIAEYQSVDRDTKSYGEMKTAIYEDRLDYYNHDVFISEAKKVEKVKNKIDHPKSGSKDCSDAVAGLVANLVKISDWDPPDIDDDKDEVLSF